MIDPSEQQRNTVRTMHRRNRSSRFGRINTGRCDVQRGPTTASVDRDRVQGAHVASFGDSNNVRSAIQSFVEMSPQPRAIGTEPYVAVDDNHLGCGAAGQNPEQAGQLSTVELPWLIGGDVVKCSRDFDFGLPRRPTAKPDPRRNGGRPTIIDIQANDSRLIRRDRNLPAPQTTEYVTTDRRISVKVHFVNLTDFAELAAFLSLTSPVRSRLRAGSQFSTSAILALTKRSTSSTAASVLS